MSVHEFTVADATGDEVSLADYAGKVLVIVNTASKCGLTPQYEGLQALQQKFGDDKFAVIGFPSNQFAGQEPGTNEEIQQFCALNYNVSFPVMAKIDVNGRNADPLFKYLKKEKSGVLGGAIKWNFTKFLIDAEGNVVKRYAPTDAPESMAPDIEALLGESAS
jgi:glutathione peroxidase